MSESPRQATKVGVGVSLSGTLMSPDKAIGKLFVISFFREPHAGLN